MIKKFLLLLVAAALIQPTIARNPRGTVVGTSWQTLEVGSGGFVRGMQIAPDGTMVARTDTNGAFYYNGFNWNQLFNVNSLPSSFVSTTDIGAIGQGCFEIQVAPSNTQIAYAVYDGFVWVSTNRGLTWSKTAFTQDTAGMNPNDAYGQFTQRMAIDPINPNIVFVGTEDEGLWKTVNGGTSWAQISTASVPVGTGAGISGILYYAGGGTSGGATQVIYAASYGNGLYKSSDGGATWTLTSSGPTIILGAAIDSSGNYYAGTSAGLSKYTGTWASLFSDANTIQAIAINPLQSGEIVALRPSGWINVSYDSGATWSTANFATTTISTDIPWIAGGNGAATTMFLDVGNTFFSPVTNGLLIVSAGTGTWKTNIPSSGFTASTAISWTDFSVGIEQLVANEIIVPPTSGSSPVLASWDRPFFKIASLTSYPSSYGPVSSTTIQMGWSIDYASSNPGTIVGLSTYNNNQSGISTDNGATWTNFSGTWQPSGTFGGTIAASTPTNIILAPSGGVQPAYTTDGGATWNGITLPGSPSWTGFDFGYFLKQRSVTADRVNANTFYLYFPGNGVYITTNSGATWTQQLAGYIEANHSLAGFNSKIISVPGNAGQLFYTPGNQTGQTPSSGSTEPFYRSINSGITWTIVTNVTGVQTFNFGAVAPGKTYPSIYIFGYVSGILAVWYSTDNAATWTSLGNPNKSLGTLQIIGSMAADPNHFGRVFVGTNGGGYAYHP